METFWLIGHENVGEAGPPVMEEEEKEKLEM